MQPSFLQWNHNNYFSSLWTPDIFLVVSSLPPFFRGREAMTRNTSAVHRLQFFKLYGKSKLVQITGRFEQWVKIYNQVWIIKRSWILLESWERVQEIRIFHFKIYCTRWSLQQRRLGYPQNNVIITQIDCRKVETTRKF